ncbi:MULTISPECIES: putative quinol monooxygenase [Clostridium]|uniref:Quinol monooxygenase n=1 Tax=Clostridium aquiflavi TaxID=3073603 RepID=A0ABU1EE65_9CLOT|nr:MULTISPECIES: putative quinol monooxygenase [unclassified Clostridium]MDR5586427.1 putative quinol monooxygenase [Clostridium sp. 5N-1]NFG63118.1 antibiotic biosynthesis monooxygenase [Clostridium botulinum]NFQ10220.1 antibiotic biosynthesis monooxygenase [Clostridium botulinum]
MIKVVARNFAKEDKINEIIELCKELVEITRKEEGCIKYEMYQDEQDAKILTMIEEWENKHSLDKHLRSEHFTRIVLMMGKLMSKETDMNVYNKLI